MEANGDIAIEIEEAPARDTSRIEGEVDSGAPEEISDIEIEEESFERGQSRFPSRGESDDTHFRDMFCESDIVDADIIDESNPPNVDGTIHADDEEMEDRKADKRRRDVINKSGMSSEASGRGGDRKRARDAHDRGTGGNQDSGNGDVMATEMNSSWNYMPTPDASVQSDEVAQHSSMLDFVCESERQILSMVLLGVDITEVYSPERVAKVCAKFQLRSGSSMDLTNGWDFDTEADRSRAEEVLEEEKAMAA